MRTRTKRLIGTGASAALAIGAWQSWEAMTRRDQQADELGAPYHISYTDVDLAHPESFTPVEQQIVEVRREADGYMWGVLICTLGDAAIIGAASFAALERRLSAASPLLA